MNDMDSDGSVDIGDDGSVSIQANDSNTNTASIRSVGSFGSTGAVAEPRRRRRRVAARERRRGYMWAASQSTVTTTTTGDSGSEDGEDMRVVIVPSADGDKNKAPVAVIAGLQRSQPERRVWLPPGQIPVPAPQPNSSDSDSGSDPEYGETPTRNFMFNMYSMNWACTLIILFSFGVLGLVFVSSGSPMFNDGYAVVPCANATLGAGVSPRSRTGRDTLWCNGPSVQAAILVNLGAFVVYCVAAAANWHRYRKMYMKRVNWMRNCLQGTVCGPLTAYVAVHYSGAAPSSWTVALVCIAAVAMFLNAYMHDVVNRKMGIRETVVNANQHPAMAFVTSVWRQLKFWASPKALADAGTTLLFTLLLADAVRVTGRDPYAKSLDGSMSAVAWMVVVCAWLAVVLRTLGNYVDPGLYEFGCFLLAWFPVYVPFLVTAVAPQVHRTDRQ